MKKLLYIFLALSLYASAAAAQSSASPVRSGSSLPATCSPNSRTGLFLKLGTGVAAGLHQCVATNKWASLANSKVYDIRAYGAKVDGVTNDSAAVKAAIDAAVLADGGTVFFPTGVTRLGSKIQMGGNDARLVIQGTAGSIIEFYRIGDDGGFCFSGLQSLDFRDVTFRGETDGISVSASGWDVNGSAIYVATVKKTTFENVHFYGLGTYNAAPYAGTGTVYLSETRVHMRDCFFGGVASTGNAVLVLNRTFGGIVENVTMIDYGTYGGFYYNKLSLIGGTKSWIKVQDPQAAQGGSEQPHLIFRNIGLDENNSAGQIDFTGNAQQTVTIDGLSLATGYGDISGTIHGRITGYREAVLRNIRIGYFEHNVDHVSFLITNVESVVLDNFKHEFGAKWLQLAGTTGKITVRRSTLQGTATHPSGIQNTAGASVDWNNNTYRAVADAAATATVDDDLIVYTSLTAGRTVALPTAAGIKGKILTVKDGSGSAGTHNITLDGSGAETIDGAATIAISTNYGIRRIVSNGTNWITL